MTSSTLTLLLCAVLLLVIAVTGFFAHSPGFVQWIAGLYVLTASLFLISSILSSKRAGIDYMMNFFFLFFIAIPAQAQITTGLFPWSAQFTYHELGQAYSLIAISHLSYVIGLSWGETQKCKSSQAPSTIITPYNDALIHNNDLLLAKWGIGVAILAVLFAGAAGPSNLLTPRISDKEATEGLRVQFTFICRSLCLLGFIMMLLLARFAESSTLRRKMAIVAMLFLPAFLLIHYPPALARFMLFGVLIALSCVLLNYQRPIIKAASFIASVFVLFLVFPIVKIIGANGSLTDLFDAMQIRTIHIIMIGVDFDAFMQIASTVQYYQLPYTDIRWANNFIGTALFFIPRSIWPSKPIHSGDIVSSELGFWYNNVSSPLHAEALLGFGLIGPALVFLCLGILVVKLEYGANKFGSTYTKSATFLAYILAMSFSTILMRGALNAVAAQIMVGFYVCWSIHRAMRQQAQLDTMPQSGAFHHARIPTASTNLSMSKPSSE